MKKAFFVLAIVCSCMSYGQVNIIPQPVSVKQPKIAANFQINAQTKIVLEGSNLENSANFLNDYLQAYYNLKLETATKATGKNSIVLNFDRLDIGTGAYNLNVDNKGVYIGGDNEEGVFYGIQSLIQLLPVEQTTALKIPFVSISDHPRFGYRGLMLDCGRHFLPVSFVKKFIDYLALHKMNYFHWHLTEDQGWRIEIKKYPRLTEVGAWRNGTIIGHHPGTGNDNERSGGFYTQEEVKDIVKYAAQRYITVVPEIEMPGHGGAAIAAYPYLSCFPERSTKSEYSPKAAWSGDTTGKQVVQAWGVYNDVFCAGKEETFKFLQDVIDEIVPLFPGQYIHVGGDECPKTHWKTCPDCQKRMKDNNLKDEHALQSYFVQRMEKYINSKGKKIIGWDEILEGGLAPNATVMSWRGEAGGIEAAKQKHNVIMTPTTYVYLDYSQTKNEDSLVIGGFLPLEKVYNYEPYPKELTAEQAKYITGVQANLWTEYISNPSKAEYMLFPRVDALSEVIWSPKEKKNWTDFQKRLETQFKRYDLWKTHYSKAIYDLKASIIPTSDNKAIAWKLETKNKEGKIIYSTGSDKNKTTEYKTPILITNAVKELNAIQTDKGNRLLGNWIEQKFSINKATGKSATLITPPANNYPGDGAFTLVNGVQNENGLAKSEEFLGFNGTDCEASIDLGTVQQISTVTAHVLDEQGSWIYRPKYFQVSISKDNDQYTSMGTTDIFTAASTPGNGTMTVNQKSVAARYVKVKVGNYGTIAEGMPGAGNSAWLFVDEIEVN
ncbi:MAG: family 20 glycosylhydrolase [Chitinophagaceae bacterium]